MAHRYHSVNPTASQFNYQANDSLDFIVNADPDRMLVSNSISMSFRLKVFKSGANRVDGSFADEICLKSCEQLFNQFTVEHETQGNIENLLYYNRYATIEDMSTNNYGDLFNVENECAGRGGYLFRRNAYVNCQQNVVQIHDSNDLVRDQDFIFQPKICLNKVISGNYEFKNGYFRIHAQLEQINKALFGVYNADTNQSYQIENVQLHYESMPVEINDKLPLQMLSYQAIKSSINSQNNTIQAMVPSKNCSGFVMSFISQNKENVFAEDSQQLEALRNISGLRFLFNNTLGERIQYEQTNVNKMVYEALRVLNSQNGRDMLNHTEFSNNEGFILGLDLKSFVDLSQTNISVHLNLDQAPQVAKNVYLYFVEIISI
jgi:hypothetical protein